MGVGHDWKRVPTNAQRQRAGHRGGLERAPFAVPGGRAGVGLPVGEGLLYAVSRAVLVRALAQGWPCRMRLLCQGECGEAKYCSTARASPAAMTCWPRLLAAIEPSKGSVMYSGSMSAPGIWLGVLK